MDSSEEEACNMSTGKQDPGGGAEEDKKTEGNVYDLSLIQVATNTSVQDAIDQAQKTTVTFPATDSSTVDKLADIVDAASNSNQATALSVLAGDSDEKEYSSHDLGESDTSTSAVNAQGVLNRDTDPESDISKGTSKPEASGEGDRKTDEEPKVDETSSWSVEQQPVVCEISSSLELGLVEEATGSPVETERPGDVTVSTQKIKSTGYDIEGLEASSVGDLDKSTGSSRTSTADYEQQCNLPLPEETDCSDHPGEKTSVYCEKCEKKICIRCVMGDHRLHDFMPFQDKIKKQHNELSDDLSAVHDLIDRVANLDGKLEVSKQGIFEIASQLKDEILKEKDRSIEHLQEQFETEIATLEAAHSSRREALEQICEEKLTAIDDHVTKQAAAADKRLADGRTTREDAANHEQAKKEAKPRLSLAELQSSTSGTKEKVTGLMATEESLKVLPVSPTSDSTDVKQHGKLGARVIVGFTKESEVQTDKTGAIKELEGQRGEIKSLTQKTLTELHAEKKNGYVAITPQSWEACREYGAGNTKDPLPLEAPDVSKPFMQAASNIVFVPLEEAKELGVIVGGGSDITRSRFRFRTVLKKNSVPVSIFVFLVNKSKYATAVKEKKRREFRGYNLLLPANQSLKDSLRVQQMWPVWWHVTITGWPNDDVLDDKLTVEEWAVRYDDHCVLYEINGSPLSSSSSSAQPFCDNQQSQAP